MLEELPEAALLAGGTDLLVDVDTGIRKARHLVSLARIPGVNGIEEEDERVIMGAGCTANEIESSSVIQNSFPEICQMVPTFASPQVRTRATVGGNICSAVACGDFPVILIALGSQVELVSSGGNRIIALGDFFLGNRETVLKKGEILTRILIPRKPADSAATYLKFLRRASNSLAVASVAVFLRFEENICRQARIVLGAVAPIPMTAERASGSLEGKTVDKAAISEAASLASKECKPITDLRGTEEFRRELVYVLTKRAVRKCSGV